MPKTINLKATIENANIMISPRFIARQMARGVRAVKRWMDGADIPETVIDRLMEVLKENDVEIIYKD